MKFLFVKNGSKRFKFVLIRPKAELSEVNGSIQIN